MLAFRSFCGAALLLPSLVVAQPRTTGSTAPALLERTAKLYTGARALRAEFTQRVSNPLTSSETQSSGSYLQRGPGVFSVAFSKPAGDRIVSDGRTLWVYVPSATPNQALKMPVGANAPGGVDLVGQFFTSPSRKFTVTDGGTAAIGGTALRKLVLVPRSDMGFSRAVLWVTPSLGELKQLEVTEASGLVRTLSFTSITRGAKLAADAFTFTVPKGVTVIDQAAMMRGM
ncbi:MAG TPA: outer membrane lipoprotein carrier protein LolA [Gemmatimonadaceae bacterium]|nr:outer membrane lipoprotein carrier protein LolA [Gemmatimonadaceae bacterium]